MSGNTAEKSGLKAATAAGPTSSLQSLNHNTAVRYEPGYLKLSRQGRLERKLEACHEALKRCRLCPRACGVNRLEGQTGFCRSTGIARVAARNVHFGEEPPVSGSRGSGTIFFSNCNLKCRFCQNYPISQLGVGRDVSAEELARIMVYLQDRGCHNVNFVTPTHYAPQIIQALPAAVSLGFSLPLVYNSNGYDSPEALALLDGIIDVYLPDMKYSDHRISGEYSFVDDYPRHNRKAVREMFRQVGFPVLDEEGIIQRGMIIRHLVLPKNASGSAAIFAYIAKKISSKTPISFMTQYFPAHRAINHPDLKQRVSDEQVETTWDELLKWRLDEGWFQESGEENHQKSYITVPNF